MENPSAMEVDSPSSSSSSSSSAEEFASAKNVGDYSNGKVGESFRSFYFEEDTSSSGSEEDFGGLSEAFLGRFCKEASKCFFEKHGLISHQLNSYNDFIKNGLQKVFDDVGEIMVSPTFDPSQKADGDWKYASIRFGKVRVERPALWIEKKSKDVDVKTGTQAEQEEYLKLLPRHARLMNLTYSGRLKVHVKWQVYTLQSVTSDKFKTGKESYINRKVLNEWNDEVLFGRLPVMVKSDLCWLAEEDKNECHFDHGGYFVIKGAEKTFIAQEERCTKRLWVVNHPSWTISYISEVKRRRVYVKLENLKTDGLSERKTITVWFMGISFPIWILFFALGAASDKEVCQMIDIDIGDPSIANLLISSIKDADEKFEGFRKGKNSLKYLAGLMKNLKYPPQESVEECIDSGLFPKLGTQQKALFLGYMVKCLLLSVFGRRKCDNRDDYRNKRLELAGELLSRELWGHVRHTQRRMVRYMQKDLSGKGFLKPIQNYIDASIVSNGLVRAFSTGTWSHSYKRLEKSSGVVATLRRTNPLQMMADLRKTRQQVLYAGMTGDARFPNPSYWGKVCFLSTPDGENCGLVKNLAVTGIVSRNSREPSMDQLICCGMEKLDLVSHSSLNGRDKVFVNGVWVGLCSDSSSFARKLRSMRRRKLIDSMVEIKRDQSQAEVRIFSDTGRILRPLLFVKNIKKLKKFKTENYSFETLLDEGIIELIGTEEEEDCQTAWGVKYLLKKDDSQPLMKYTHCELDLSFLLGLSCGIIPFANHNLARRVLYQSEKHSQQAIGFSTTNPNIRVDTNSQQLYYPQRPLCQSIISECLGKPKYSKGYNDKIPKPEIFNGQNAIVAVNVHLGYNQEDSLVMNRASLERGLFRTEHTRSYKSEVDNAEILETRRLKLKDPVKFCKVQSKLGSVDNLDEDGFPYIGANLQSWEIVIGKAAESGADHSVKLKHTERGRVQKVVLSANDDGKIFAVVSLRQVRSPCLGDKFSSMHGQKGVVGFLEAQENFPFTAQGIVPDIVINPHAFPTRQTPGQLLEAALGKGIACGGPVKYATPFTAASVEIITEQLHRAGFCRWGTERVYNGRNGEMMPCLIFMGPTFYQRLVHMAEDKVKFRNTGPVHPLTRQPVADRKRFGGVKFGEMERDCLLAHGAAANLHERLFRLSDYSHMYICHKCERVTNVILRPTAGGRKIRGPYCRFCESGENILKVDVPYGAKLLTQELFSMGICLKFKVEEC
ncbi:DNA-directed RNA polymerases IV and V subunit 2 [Aristolochia californica]|uniref:DNA-directed RNA polymerases IV and V subunit 2 n=1 Tax=Aristolochia californica TaxID=171875 RepID=UPI0035D94B63